MRFANRPALFTAAAMLLVAVLVLFLLPPPHDDSERAFRFIVAVAAIFAAIVKLRRATRGNDRP
ncbi:MAG TPA: hypothetical protein VNT42_00490 [Sphingomonas sp.]|nr:hypothetical protein [Sphingomonas sp.]